MFILKRVLSDGVIISRFIGKAFTLSKRNERDTCCECEPPYGITSYISYFEDSKEFVIPIYSTSVYTVLSDNGDAVYMDDSTIKLCR